MKRLLFTFICILSYAIPSFAQFAIGSVNLNITDPSRSRNFPVYIYYPAVSAGTSVSLATPPPSGFPVVILGHGFAMDYSAYLNFRDSLVPKGYVVMIPNSESAIVPFPSQPNFGKDLAYCISWISAQDSTLGSIFYGKISDKRAIMGHSMGGGCTYLAAQNNPAVTTTITFAAAETNPLSSSAAKQVNVPSLVFAGQNDCVAPLSSNQQKIYDSLGSSCKTLINIKNGGHCQYANSNLNCDFGETTCRGFSTLLTRPQQQSITFQYLYIWLDFYLKGNCSAFTDFQALISSDTRITYQKSCSYYLPSANIFRNGPATFCNDTFTTLFCPGSSLNYQWSDGSTDSFIRTNRSFTYVCTVTDGFGCKDTSNSITINAFIPLKPKFSKLSPINLCNDSIKVDVIGNFSQLLWNDSLRAPSRYLSNTGLFFVSTKDSNNCKSISDSLIVTNTSPLFPPDFNVTDTQICSGNILCISADTSFTHIRWNTSDTNTFLCKSYGNFWYSCLDSNRCKVYSDTLSIDTFTTVLPSPMATSLFEFYLPLTYSNVLWYNDFGTVIDTGNWFVAPDFGTYSVMATDTNNYSSTNTFNVAPLSNSNLLIANNVQIFPNPCTHQLQIQSGQAIQTLQIISFDGQLIQKISPDSNKINLNLDKVPQGFYLLRILLS